MGTISCSRLLEEIVREYFDALDTSDSVQAGGFGSQREMTEADLKNLDLDGLESGPARATGPSRASGTLPGWLAP